MERDTGAGVGFFGQKQTQPDMSQVLGSDLEFKVPESCQRADRAGLKGGFTPQAGEGLGIGAFASKLESLSHHKNAKDFVTVAGLLVCVLTYAGGDAKTFELEAGIKAVRDWTATTAGVSDVVSSVYKVGNLAFKCFAAGSLSPLFDGTSNFSKWEVKVKDYVVAVQNYASQTNISLDQLLDQGTRLIDESRGIELEARQTGGKCYAVYADTARLLRTAYATLETRHANAGIRQEPLGVCLYGPPGIGKSFLTSALHRGHCMVQGVTNAAGSCFTFTGDTDFMDGLTSNVITFVLDDVGKNNNKAVPMDVAISVIIGVVNSTPYVPNMASLEDKGKTIFQPKLVIATTNTLGFNARAYVATPDAVWRRFPIIIIPTVKPEYAAEDGVKLSVERGEIPTAGFPDWWNFKVQKVQTRGSLNPVYTTVANFNTTAAMIAYVMDRVKKNRSNFAKVEQLNNALDAATSSLCDECFRSVEACDDHGQFSPCPCDGYTKRAAASEEELRNAGTGGDRAEQGGDFEPQSYVGGAFDKSGPSIFQTLATPFIVIFYWLGKFLWFLIYSYCYMSALAAFFVGIYEFAETCLTYMSAWGNEDEVAIKDNILKWTYSAHTAKAVKVRKLGMNTVSYVAIAALLYGLGRVIQWRITNVYKKVDQTTVLDHKVPAWMIGKTFVEAAAFLPEAAWPTPDGDTPCVWRKSQFDRVTAVSEYCRTSSARDVKRIVDNQQVYLAFYNTQDCGDNSFLGSVHGVFLNNTTIMTVTHALEPLVKLPHIWVRVYLRGGIVPVVRKFDTGAIYTSKENPDVSVFWFQGQLPGIIVKGDPNGTPFIGRGHTALGECIMSVSSAYRATKHGSEYEETQTGHVVQFQDNHKNRYGNLATCKGRIAFSELSRTGNGSCGSPLFIKTGNSTNPKLSVVGIHIGAWCTPYGNWAVTAVVDGTTAVELVQGLALLQDERRGVSVSKPLVEGFQPSGPALAAEHTLTDAGPNSSFSPQWLQKEDTIRQGVRVSTFGTIRCEDGSIATSGVGGKSPVCDTPFRSIAERLGYVCDKVGAVFTHTHKTKHLLKVDGGLHSPPPMMVELVAQGVLSHWKDTLKVKADDPSGFYGTYRLPWEQAVNGIPECTYFDKLNMASSAGYPWRCSKKSLFSRDENGLYTIPQTVMQRIGEAEAAYDSGKLAGHVFTASFKHEPVSPEKIQAHKGRVIYAGSVDYSIMVRRYFGTLMVHLQHNQEVYGSYVGTNPESHAWGRLIKRLSDQGSLFAGDYSGFDTSAFSSHMMHTVYGMLIDMNVWLNQEGMRPEGSEAFTDRDIKHMWGLAGDTSSPMINFFGDLLQYESLNPSGHPLTTPFNGVGNIVLICCAYVQAMHDRSGATQEISPVEIETYTRKFFRCVKAAVYGDDHVVGTSDTTFDFVTFKESLAKFGIKVTTADSSKGNGNYTFLPVEEIDFLKRAFVTDHELGVVKAPLRDEVIAKMFCVWVVKPGEDEVEHVGSVLRAISLAASQHTREYFEEVTGHIQTIIREKGYNEHALFGANGLPTYDQYMDAAYKGIGLPDYEAFVVPEEGSMEGL
jgi:hypothetical protein